MQTNTGKAPDARWDFVISIHTDEEDRRERKRRDYRV